MKIKQLMELIWTMDKEDDFVFLYPKSGHVLEPDGVVRRFEEGTVIYLKEVEPTNQATS